MIKLNIYFIAICSSASTVGCDVAAQCMMCGVSKGTSTRRSRINTDHMAVQLQQALLPPPPAQKPASSRAAQPGETSGGGSQEAEPAPGPSTAAPQSKKKTPKAWSNNIFLIQLI